MFEFFCNDVFMFCCIVVVVCWVVLRWCNVWMEVFNIKDIGLLGLKFLFESNESVEMSILISMIFLGNDVFCIK